MGDNTREVERTFIGHLVVAFLEAAPEGARIEVSRECDDRTPQSDGRTFITFIGRDGSVDRVYLRLDVSCLERFAPRSEGRGMAWELRKAAGGAVCEVCNDTHMMPYGERRVMCTYCPVPCRKCACDSGRGAFCETTPCDCDCHRRSK